jgi:hypothetical protein
MSLDTIFTFELVLVALMIGWMLAGAIYIGLHDRRIRRETGRLVGTADIAVGLAPDELSRGVTESPAPRQAPRREFYERIGARCDNALMRVVHQGGSPGRYFLDLKGFEYLRIEEV